jgi:hypothetical protein
MLLLTRVADAAVTFQYSPDLAHEANPIVHVFGGGWGELLALNAILLIGVFALLALWWRRPVADTTHLEAADTFWVFASRSRYGRVYPRGEFLARSYIPMYGWRWPRLGHFARELGLVVPPVVSLLSLVSILNWYLLFGAKAPWFWAFWRAAFPWYPYVIPTLPLYMALSLCFYRIEWAHARRSQVFHDA